MNRFRTGRPAPPWAGGQTGPMTVDVEALWASRNRDPVPNPVNGPVKYVSPLTASAEYERLTAKIHTEAVPAEPASVPTTEVEPDDPTGPFRTVKLHYVGPDSSPEPAAKKTETPSEHAPTELERLAAKVRALAAQADLDLPEPAERATPRSRPKPRKRPKRKPRPIPTLKRITVRPSAPRPQSKPKSQPKSQIEIDLARHKRRCSICHHPDREAIEEAFLQWRRVRNIDSDFKPEGGPTAIYRHTRAFNLFKQRNLNLRTALEFVIERAENVVPTAEGLVKAIRAYTRINDQGEWIDTPTTHIVKVMPMFDPEPRNVTNSASAYPHERKDAGSPVALTNRAGSVTLDVKKISDCPRDGAVEVTIEAPSGRPLLTGSAPHSETCATT